MNLAASAALALGSVTHLDWAGHMDWDSGWRSAAMVATIAFWLLVAVAAVRLARRALEGEP